MDDFKHAFGDWWTNDTYSPVYKEWARWFFDYDLCRPGRPCGWIDQEYREWMRVSAVVREAVRIKVTAELKPEWRNQVAAPDSSSGGRRAVQVRFLSPAYASLAQLVEHFHGKEGVIRSNRIGGL